MSLMESNTVMTRSRLARTLGTNYDRLVAVFVDNIEI